jgi:hypothetical protein
VAQVSGRIAAPRSHRLPSELRRERLLRLPLANAIGRASVRSVFFVTLTFNQALCSACALVSAAVLGGLASLPFGVDILITQDIRLAPGGCVGQLC